MGLLRKKKGLLAAMLAFGIAVLPGIGLPVNAVEQDLGDLNALESQQSDLQQQEEQLDEQLQSIRDDQSKQQEYKNTLDEKISVVQQQIDTLMQEIESLDTQITQKNDGIADTQQQIDENFELLKERIRAIYMAGETSTLDIILNAQNVTDLFDKAELLKRVSEHDQKLIDNLNTSLASIQQEKDDIEQKRDQVAQAKKDLDAKRQELETLQAESNQLLEQLGQQAAQTQQELDEIQQQKDALSDEIAQWHKEYVRQQQEQAQQQQQQQEEQTASSQTPSEPETPSSTPDAGQEDPSSEGNGGGSSSTVTPPSSSTRYIWPVPSCTVITSYYGDRPIYGYHRGIDIGAQYGAEIVAAADGVVIMANSTDSWGSGWGYYVMIDHGGGYATLYAHCSRLAVSVGQTVQAGQVIGYVGNTGNSYGAHLHFETYLNGERYDPMTELPSV